MAIDKTSVKDIIDKNYAEFDLGLLCEDKYKSLKHIDMVVYTLLNNQHGLSIKTTLNGSKRYIDKSGYIFISIAREKLCKILRTTRPTLNASLKRLQELDLVEVVNIGNMKCDRIYVGKLKRTVTLGDYMKSMSIGEEEQEDYTPKIDVLHIEEAKKIAENKKAPTFPEVEADKNKFNDNNSISRNKKKYTKKDKLEKNSNNEVVEVIKKSCVNIKKEDLKDCISEFTDIDKLKEALTICEINNTHGIKALRMAYKYGDIKNNNSNNSSNMSNKKKGTIFMADSKVMVDGKLKSVTELTKEEFELKLAQKWGRNKV
jgi:hypothetical protein